jgi:hypothetical protein
MAPMAAGGVSSLKVKGNIEMGIFSTLKLAAGTVLGIIVLALWFFGGIIGAFIGIANNDALSAVLSLLIPCFGAIYTIVMAIQGIF